MRNTQSKKPKETPMPEVQMEMDDCAERIQETVDAPSETEGVYRTQKEIDAVIGRRLREEREQWERRHAAALLLEKAMGDQRPEEAAAALIARGNSLEEQDVMEAVRQGIPPEQMIAAARQRALERQAQGLMESQPGFSLEWAMQSPAFKALIEAGEPVEKAYAYLQMDGRIQTERQAAQDELMSRIRARRTRPNPLRPASAMGEGEGEAFPDSVMRMIDARLKRGERVSM